MIEYLTNITNSIFKRHFPFDLKVFTLYQDLLTESAKAFKTEKEKQRFHMSLLHSLEKVIKPVNSSICILYHLRKDGDIWKCSANSTITTLPITKQLESLADEHSLYQIENGNSLLSAIKLKRHGFKAKQGLMFQFFNDYDYLIISGKEKLKTINLFNFLKRLIIELQTKIEQHLKINELENQAALLDMQLIQNQIKLRGTERELKKRKWGIDNLLEVSNNLYSILNLKQLIHAALLTISGQIPCQKSIAMLYEPVQRKYSTHFTKGFRGKGKININIEMDHPLVNLLLNKPYPIKVEDLNKIANLKQVAKQFKKNQIELIAPIIFSERVKGVVGCGSKLNNKAFEETDLEIFAILVNIISISISNAQMYEDVKKMSFTDAMTNLHNYRYFKDRLHEEINRSLRKKTCVSLIMLDIDKFKNYNDTLGHQSGDEALRSIGWVLKNTARDDDIVHRYGGEEFSIILPGFGKKDIHVLAERVREKVEEYPFYKEHVQPGGKLTISLGSATFPDDADTFEDLVFRADQALYKSKKSGRNKFTRYEPGV